MKTVLRAPVYCGETDLAVGNAEKIAKALGYRFDLAKCD